jgi:predicted nucleic acid-binding protein
MPPSVYIETSIVSYLVARPSRDPIMAERQRQTRDWWENHRGEYRLVTSESVVREAARGEAAMATRRLTALSGCSVLAVDAEVQKLAEALVTRGPLPSRAEADAYHIALATVHRLEYLLTWNCRHIANPGMYRTIERVCSAQGLYPPLLCTPEELLRRSPHAE